MSDGKDGNLIDQIFGNQAVEEEQKGEKGQAPQVSGEPGQKQEEEQKESQEPVKKLAGRFESVEELEKAYRELEKWGTRKSQEAAAIRRELEELRKQAAPDMTARQQEEWRKQVQAAINAATVDENPEPLLQLIGYMADKIAEEKVTQQLGEIAPLVQQHRFQREVDAWLAENPEAGEHINDMIKLINAEPELVTRPGWLDRAYSRVLRQKVSLAKQVGAETSAKIQAEKQAAGMPGAGARNTKAPETDEEKLLKTIFGESGPRKMFDF